MNYDQRRIYGTTVGLVFIALGVLVLVRGGTWTGVLVIVWGVALAAGAISGRRLRQRPDDTTDPPNRH